MIQGWFCSNIFKWFSLKLGHMYDCGAEWNVPEGCVFAGIPFRYALEAGQHAFWQEQ
jgi:hypothetical protein